ncbi:hypothetical protein [Streptomyces sp. NPDC046976]|uniref:hypothetical protein n=1 Tax=Streptomyces sp. NPDC046976 TaxID=3155258 RepID=UPI0034110BE3
MTTNTAKRPAATAEDIIEITEDRSVRVRRAPAVVGPPLLSEDEKPVALTLSHHLRIGSTDYAPGAEIRVSPDYARRLRGQGFVART